MRSTPLRPAPYHRGICSMMDTLPVKDRPPRALALFTDRDEQRAAIAAHFGRLREGLGHTQGAVLSFYGVGGVGKTTLREKGIAEFRARLKRDLYSIEPFALAEVDLDNDSVRPDIQVDQMLGRVRTALHRAGISTPLFDYAYLMWWKHDKSNGASLWSERGRGESWLAGLIDVADLAANLGSMFGLSLPSMATVQSLHKLFPKLYDWFQDSSARTQFDGSPQSWSQDERTQRMPVLLALDLLQVIARKPQTAICLVIDGFERVQSRQSVSDGQWALATMVAEVIRCVDLIPGTDDMLLRGRIGFMIFGREKLRWAEFYARERVRTDWKREIVEHPELLGLTEEDARGFLIEKAAPWEREQGRPEVAELIERHADALLQAACERLSGRAPSYLPYYLDLAVDAIRNSTATFTPDMLGETPAELERRFLRSLDPRHRRALQALAVTLEFDREMFDFLKGRGDIEGYDFAWLVGDHWSFVSPIEGRPGFHGFHRHMQASLVASLQPTEELERAREILNALIERLFERIRFDQPADFGPMQESALSDVMDLLREHAADGLMDGEAAVSHALKLESLFESIQAASLREPFLEWTAQSAQTALGPDHQDTLRTRANIAALSVEAGEPAAALVLFRALLPDFERVLGPDHLDTLTIRNYIASLTGQVGEPGTARDLFLALLPDMERMLGPDHPDTLLTRNNIATFTGEAGEPAAARDLFRALLPDEERVIGPDHPHTLQTRAKIASWTGHAGDPATARDLFRDLLPDYERVFGPDHPDTLATRTNIAYWTGQAGDPATALELFRALLLDQERVLGPDHPNTLETRGRIARLEGGAA